MLRFDMKYKQDKLSGTRFIIALVNKSNKYTVKFLKNRCVIVKVVK